MLITFGSLIKNSFLFVCLIQGYKHFVMYQYINSMLWISLSMILRVLRVT